MEQLQAHKWHRRIKILVVFFAVVGIAGCATHYGADAIADPYGFFSGLWHGAIASFTITINIISWFLQLIGVDFLRDIEIIGKPNTGFFYYAGFAMGFLWLSIFR